MTAHRLLIVAMTVVFFFGSELEGQNAPPLPECTDSTYAALKVVPRESRTEAEQERFQALDLKCKQALITYYRRNAKNWTMPPPPMQSRRFNEEPAEALVWSLLIPGGGQLYNGDEGKALLFMGANLAGWTALAMSGDEEWPGWAVGLSIGVIGGSYWGSLLDAVRSAR